MTFNLRFPRWLDGAIDWLRDPPDLVERPPAVQFVIAVFPDMTSRITATKLTSPNAPEVTAITQAAIDMLFRWAASNGVRISVNGAGPPAPAKNPLRGVRP